MHKGWQELSVYLNHIYRHAQERPDSLAVINSGEEISYGRFARAIEDVRSFLFGPPGAGGFDLAALNIQRGRDMGVASYNNLREAMGLKRAEAFSDITSDADLAARLKALYGDTDLVDAWVPRQRRPCLAAQAANHVDGPRGQFHRLRRPREPGAAQGVELRCFHDTGIAGR